MQIRLTYFLGVEFQSLFNIFKMTLKTVDLVYFISYLVDLMGNGLNLFVFSLRVNLYPYLTET